MEGTTFEALLQSLLTDRDGYVAEGVVAPRYIVVSGDLIHGGSSEEEIRGQYAETRGFLEQLVHEFLEGDKNRMLIVPGNHDMSHPHSKDSMIPESDANNKVNLDQMKAGNPLVRWNWKEFMFYKIANAPRYAQRFDLFREFYDGFYEGERTYPVDPVVEAECYPYGKDKVTFALFNSCHQLDHLWDTAFIDEEAIVSVTPKLRKSYNKGYVNIGVWHHHYYGSPRETNYMDREVINRMSHSYLQMGLFGHQHISQVAEFYGGDLSLGEAPDNQRLLLVSSGTLFGGRKELPEGRKRQYNVIEISHENGRAAVEIHVREDDNRSVQSKLPIWHGKLISPTSSIRTEIKLRQLDEKTLLVGLLREAQESGDYISAFEELKGKEHIVGYSVIRSEIVRGIKDNRYLLNHLRPQNKNEYLLLMSCAEAEQDTESKEQLKNDPTLQAMLDDSIVRDMYERL